MPVVSWPPDPDRAGAIGATMFDLPGSDGPHRDRPLPQDHIEQAPSQALVRIKSRDGLKYLGMVTAGPFAEPDSLRADSHLLVTVTARGGVYLPPYHGRVKVVDSGRGAGRRLVGAAAAAAVAQQPGRRAERRRRPAKSSAPPATSASARVVGYRNVVVNVPSRQEGGVAAPPRRSGHDRRGEIDHRGPPDPAGPGRRDGGYPARRGRRVHAHARADRRRQDADRPAERGLAAAGVPADRDDAVPPRRPRHHQPAIIRSGAQFSLQFARLSPYAIMEILDLTDAQRERFMNAYDIAKEVMRDLGIFPAKHNAEQERMAAGTRRVRARLPADDVVAAARRGRRVPREGRPAAEGRRARQGEGGRGRGAVQLPAVQRDSGIDRGHEVVADAHARREDPGQRHLMAGVAGQARPPEPSEGFHNDKDGPPPLKYKQLLRPGNVSVVDLSDSGASELNNLVIADLLHGVQDAQDEAYAAYEKAAAGRHGPAARAHHHRGGARVPQRGTDRQDANPVRAGFDDRAGAAASAG